MKVQPEARNSITIILDDGTEFKLHDALHGDKDYLFIRCGNNLKIDTMVGLDWQPLINVAHYVRLSGKEEK